MTRCEDDPVPQDSWAGLADAFVDGAYASVKGRVRTFVLHRQLLRHLPEPPATIVDVGGGAAHQSLPLARLGYDVTVLDPSAAMLAKAEQRVGAEPLEVRRRIRLIEAAGEHADTATGGERFTAALCHGVLMYVDDPRPMIDALCRCVRPGGIVSIMALNVTTLAVRPALERRWTDALAAFDAVSETACSARRRAATPSMRCRACCATNGVEPTDRYGVWLFLDWLAELPVDTTDIAAVAEVELQASLRDPYRRLSRVFHLVGRRPLA